MIIVSYQHIIGHDEPYRPLPGHITKDILILVEYYCVTLIHWLSVNIVKAQTTTEQKNTDINYLLTIYDVAPTIVNMNYADR